MATQLQDGETILFIGDSITDCGRMNPGTPYGTGYVNLFRDLLIVREPEKSVTVINTGIGGHTVLDLRQRWVDDALSHQPDWLSVKIGINDCHQHLSDPGNPALMGPQRYTEIFGELLALTKQELPDVKLLLIDPFFGSLDLNGQLPESGRARVHATLPGYIATVDRLGEQYDARRVKTHDLFHAQFKHQDPVLYFPNEPVHPNPAGHLLIAEAVYNALS